MGRHSAATGRGRLTLASTALALALALSLAGCDRKMVELTPDEMEHLKLRRLDPNHGQPIGPVITEFGIQEGMGEVVALDPVALTVALRHRQDSREDWPGMVMTFRLQRRFIGALSPGQKVYFRATARDGAGEILQIRPVPKG